MSDSNLPQHWQKVAIKEIAKVVTGTTPSTKNEQFWGGSIPFITPAELNGGYVFDTERKITEQGLKVSRPLPQGAVAVSCIGYIGKVGIVYSPIAVTNQQINSVIPLIDKADSWFLAYLFQKIAPRLKDSAGVTTVPILNKSNFESFQISLPPLKEQRAIAHALRAVQEAKEARQRELMLERERKAALMQYLFTHGTRGETRKQTEIGEMPESWRVLKMGRVVEMKYGYQTSIPKTPPPDGVKIISTAEIMNDGRLNLAKIRTVEVPRHLIESYCVAQNDILFNWRNSQEHVGKAAIVDFTPQEPTVYASFIIRLRTNAEVLYNYLHALLTYLRNQGLFFKLSRRAVNQANFNANELAAVDLSIPSLDEQQEITNVLDACDNKISALENEFERLDELFRAMLEELMTGRLSALPLIESEKLEASTAHT